MTTRGTTTQRGYGWEHQKARAAAIRDLKDGTPCPFPWCHKPMYRSQARHLDYDHYPPLALGGGGTRRLSHARCNRQAGQQLGVQRRTSRKRQPPPQPRSRNW